jgi:hypothetical protein
MRLASIPVATSAILLLAIAAVAAPSERDRLNACQALVDRATRLQPAGTANTADEAGLQECRQIIKEWTLRDSRMSVDEHGRPLR